MEGLIGGAGKVYKLANISQFESLMNTAHVVINNRMVVDNDAMSYVRNLFKQKKEPKPERLGQIKYGWKSKLAKGLLNTILGAGILGSTVGGLYQLGIYPVKVTPTTANKVVPADGGTLLDKFLRHMASEPEWMRDYGALLGKVTRPWGHAMAYNDLFKFSSELANDTNYQAAIQKWNDSIASNPRLTQNQKYKYRKAFDLFGRLCSHIDIDMRKTISKINIDIKYNNQLAREFTLNNTVHLNADSSPGTIFHELIHSQQQAHEAIQNVVCQSGLVMGRYTDSNDWNGDGTGIATSEPKNVLRNFTAGYDPRYRRGYPGKMYMGKALDNDLTRTYVKGDYDPNVDYVYGMVTRPGASKASMCNDEYLPMFASQYVDRRLPLLYAMYARNLINGINRESRRLGTSYWPEERRQADIAAHSPKTKPGVWLNKIGQSIYDKAQKRLDQKGKEMRKKLFDQNIKEIQEKLRW